MKESFRFNLAIAFLFYLPLSSFAQNGNCGDYVVKVEISKVNHTNLISAEIESSSKNDLQAIYNFFDSNDIRISYDLNSKQVDNLSVGKYYCLIVINQECIVRKDFEITKDLSNG